MAVPQSRAAPWALPWLLLAVASLAAILLVNGYPLVFPDSGTYIYQAVHFQGVLQRPPYYSLFIRPLHLTISLWPVPLVQDVIVTLVTFRGLSLAFARLTAARIGVVIALTAATTSLPWFSNQVMPDFSTPLIVLLVFGIGVCWHRLHPVERLLAPAALLVAVAFHQASTAFTLGLLVPALLLAWGAGVRRAALLGRGALVVVPVVLAALAQASYGYVVVQRFTPSPYGSVFLLARMLADGDATRYLRTACPAAGYVLCRDLDALTEDQNDFLWRPGSPLPGLVRDIGDVGVINEASAIVGATLRAYPRDVLRHAIRNASIQFVTFATNDSDCPCVGDRIDQVVATLFPREHAAYLASRQNRGTLPWPALSVLHLGVVVAAAATLAAVALLRRRWLAGDAGRLVILVGCACVGNAIIMGALSGVADRYQARLVWLVPLLAFAVLLSPQTRRP